MNNLNNNNMNMNVQNNNFGYQQGIMNNNNINNGNMSNYQQNNQNNTGFGLYFRVSEEKEVYFNTNPNTLFRNILFDLMKENYWLPNTEIKLMHDNLFLSLFSTPTQNGIKSKTKIDLIY